MVRRKPSSNDPSISIYPPPEMIQRWKPRVKTSGTSISKFVAEYVENSLRQEGETEYKSRNSLIEQNRLLSETINEKEGRISFVELSRKTGIPDSTIHDNTR
jgi:Fic family protein